MTKEFIDSISISWPQVYHVRHGMHWALMLPHIHYNTDRHGGPPTSSLMAPSFTQSSLAHSCFHYKNPGSAHNKYMFKLTSLKMFSECTYILTPTNTSTAHIRPSTNYLYTITHNWQSPSLICPGFPRHTTHENHKTQMHFKLHNTQQQWGHTILTTLYYVLKILLGIVVIAMLI